MPIGGFAAIFALLVLSTLGSGYFLILRANAAARALERPENDVVSAASRPPGRRASRASVRIAAAVFLLSLVGVTAFIGLYVSGTIDSSWTRNDPSVERP